MQLPGAKRVTFVRSVSAHAKILGIDASAATEIPGTQVFTAADVDLQTNPLPPFLGIDALAAPLPRFQARFVSSATSSRSWSPTVGSWRGRAELVAVEYDALPAVTNLSDAARDEVVLFGDVGTNVCMRSVPSPLTSTYSTTAMW